MGGINQRWIIVGTVEEIFRQDSLIERYALLKPFIDFNSIEEVFILKEKEDRD